MDTLDMALRIVCAVAVGGAIGWERERGHRPAGFRTHILVTVGAALVTMTGLAVAKELGASDAMRMAAQVVSGIGFLGAGTIMREGLTVKGLTTAATLWTSACLGIALGAGFYTGALLCALVVIVTLTVFERWERKIPGGKYTRAQMTVICRAPASVIENIGAAALQNNFSLRQMKAEELPGGMSELRFELVARSAGGDCDFNYMAARVTAMEGVTSMQIEEF